MKRKPAIPGASRCGLLLTLLASWTCSMGEPESRGGHPGAAGRAGTDGGVAGGGALDAAVDGPEHDARRDSSPDLEPPGPSDGGDGLWRTSFVPGCLPSKLGGRAQDDGHHRPGEDCMQAGCHAGESPGAGPPFLFGGTVRRAGSLATYSAVEVAVKVNATLYTACSATNGNFWVAASEGQTLDWTVGRAGVRTSKGESLMLPAPEAGCNGCHSQLLLLTAP